MKTTAPHIEPGARWLRCDLHVHTPFDAEKKFGEDIRGAMSAFRNERPERLAKIADRFVQACRNAADGEGMDLVALTDHNSIDGYRYLRAQFETLERQARDQVLPMPAILPGVEFSVGGERPIHFLVIFSADTEPVEVDRAIAYVFRANDRFDPKSGTPRATGHSVIDFLDDLYEFCQPPSGDRNMTFIVLPAHVDGRQGLSREVVGGAVVSDVTVATSIWDEMKGHLRQRVITRRDWHGFQAARSFEALPHAFRELLVRWAAARRSEDWDVLTESQKGRHRDQKHWPIVQCSDPHNYEAIGSSFTWLKMAVPNVEGIRLALLDPESRLRRMTDGPPKRTYTRMERLRVRHTDYFEEIEIPLNPCLTTLIGGRGTGKSTVVEYLRYVLDRARAGDLQDHDYDGVQDIVGTVLSRKGKRDFGHKEGTLLPEHEVTTDVVVAERRYRVSRSGTGFGVVQDADEPSGQLARLDVHTLVRPRILSQRQIARIARNPASQRIELDALIDANRLRDIENQRRLLQETLAQLQATRKRLRDQIAKRPSVETELLTVLDQISFLQGEGRKEALERFGGFERQRIWLDDRRKELTGLAARFDGEAAVVALVDSDSGAPPPAVTTTWLLSVAERICAARGVAAAALREQASALRAMETTIEREQVEQWQMKYDEARSSYEALREEMTERGVDFSQHEKLLQRRAQLERELALLESIDQELNENADKLRDTRLRLVEMHEARLAARRDQAQSLEAMDADVRLNVLPFRDRWDLEGRREQWFGGAGLQERDWSVLCDYVFATNGQVPDRIAALVGALRDDIEITASSGEVLDESASKVVNLVGPDRHLTKFLLNALTHRNRIRLDEIERFLPEDLVKAQIRTADGSFKTIETGSVGEKSTAILSLLLSAGDQPIIIDQPEDDLDNQYVYNVVVDLLRRRKFSRQVIIATHNANIPVNGDAELIVALGAKNRLGEVLGSGSIDQPEIKDLVSVIMEGSAEAFRLRRERYGY